MQKYIFWTLKQKKFLIYNFMQKYLFWILGGALSDESEKASVLLGTV